MLINAASSELVHNAADHRAMFNSFKMKFKRNYNSMDEENNRFKNFVNNLAVIDARNKAERAAGGSAEHGVTKFSDLTDSEFRSRLGYVMNNSTNNNIAVVPTTTATFADWTGIYTTAVKNQG